MGRLLAKQLCWHYSNRLLSRNLNKRPMGHNAYVRNQYKPKNTYDYVITLIKQEAHGPHRSPEKPVQINKHI